MTTQVKLFKFLTHNELVTGTNESGLQYMENLINNFLKETKADVKDIKIDVQKNFLPGTVMGEFQEVWTAMVWYAE